jgi:Family of unknown function (DUF5906)
VADRTPLEIALDVIARGIAPVPVPRTKDAKGPNIREWQHLVVTPENAAQYFDSGRLVNVGAIMGPRSGGLTDVDLDCPEAIALALRFLPGTGSVYGRASKRRSHYLYTLTDDPGPKATRKFLDENKAVIVELRLGGGGKGAQSIWPGSLHVKSNERYEWDADGERRRATLAELTIAVTKIAVATVLVRHWPEKNRHEAAMRVGGFLARVGWQEGDIAEFVVAVQRVAGVADPDHIENGRAAAVDSARNYAETGGGYGLPALAEFFGEEVAKTIAKHLDYKGDEHAFPIDDPNVARLNETFALVIVGDKTAVMKTSVEEGVQLLSVSAFTTWHENQFVLRGGRRVPLGKYWLAHPNRRQYEGLVFAPDRDVDGHYNLWRCFAIEPRPGDCSKFKAHLLDNVCGGSRNYYDWLFGFFADIFQNPGDKKGSAVALRGKEGVGKTIVGAIFGSLLGPHYRLVAEPRYVTGRFNSHVVQILLLHADEAFWAGDRSGVGKLKDMVTGKQHPIEFKGKEAIWVDNHLRIFTTGDNDWIVPAGFDARRWLVLTVDDAHQEDHAYFAAIDAEMANGGREALLYELLHFDLSEINLRSVPKTAALFEQKERTFTIDQTWWYDVLQRGELPHLENGCECPKHMLHEDYLGRTERLGRRADPRSTATALGMFLSKMVGPALNPNARDAANRRYYRFPPLKVCRARFAELTHHPIEWDAPDAVWEKEAM